MEKYQRLQRLCLALMLLWLNFTIEAADTLKGAESILQMVAEKARKTNDEIDQAPGTILRKDLEEFPAKSESLQPEAAATQWLQLVDRLLTLELDFREDPAYLNPLSAADLIKALPPPASWNALARQISNRAVETDKLNEYGLRLIAAALTNNKTARDQILQDLQKRSENATQMESYTWTSFFDAINQGLMELSDDPDSVLKILERQMSRELGRRMQIPITIPNLVVLVGEEKTKIFLKKALTNSNVELQFDQNNATSQLARNLVVENINDIKTPPWSLVNSFDSTEFYEKLNEKFPRKTNPATPLDPYGNIDDYDYKRSHADSYYLLGLISKNRSKDAVMMAEQIGKRKAGFPYNALAEMERAGYITALDNFFFELLSKNPGLPFWDSYVSLAAKAGRTARMLELARNAATNSTVSKRERGSIHNYLYKALLADGQVDEGVTEIKKLIASTQAQISDRHLSRGELGLNLAQLGNLLGNRNWFEEGLKVALSSLTNQAGRNQGWVDHSLPASISELLIKTNRIGEAEDILATALANSIEQMSKSDMNYLDDSEPQALLSALASLYYQTGRNADVISLLEKAPYWGKADLSDFLDNLFGYSPFRMEIKGKPVQLDYPLLWLASSALYAEKRTSEARKITYAYLDQHPGNDRGYELLLKLDGTNAHRKLDELFARDQFEERPLIWKAKLLADEKDYVKAEETVRKAISIDPSDGEQGPGDRMRAYSILAEIRATRGDAKEAEFFTNVVKAIRLSEEADVYYAVGLLKKAVEMYKQSLTHFADAYCIQSRLAIQLAELGLHEEAEAHYRRAYELMPDSFGRVESHCFGCEQAFAGAKAQSIAEKVFTDLAAKQPNKPQVHYMLGYLRYEQQRYTNALPHFRRAVELDNQYLNAWEKLLQASSNIRIPAREKEQIIFNLLRLDPLRRHSHPDLRGVTDLEGLWNAVAASNSLRPQKPDSLFVLTASKAATEKIPRNRHRSYFFSSTQEILTPAGAIAETAYIEAAAYLLQNRELEE